MKTNYNIIKSIEIDAEPSKVFSVLSNLENWNLWTKSISKISFLENSKFFVGGKVEIIQPKMPSAIWVITEINENQSFTWTTKKLGVTITGEHALINRNQKTFVEIRIKYDGFLASFLYKIGGKLTTEYLTLEINGLKKECEKHNSNYQG